MSQFNENSQSKTTMDRKGVGAFLVILVKLATYPSHPKQCRILGKMDENKTFCGLNISRGWGGGEWNEPNADQKIVIRSPV